ADVLVIGPGPGIAATNLEAKTEPIGDRAKLRLVIRPELFASHTRHAEYINCCWHNASNVHCMSCRKRGERGTQTVTGDEERLASAKIAWSTSGRTPSSAA